MKLERHELLAIAKAAVELDSNSTRDTSLALTAIVERHRCPQCYGSGWVTRDPDIGTDQECPGCDGSGMNDDD